MVTLILTGFILGYLFIAFEHPLKINKSGIALITGAVLWVLYTFTSSSLVPVFSAEAFSNFLVMHPGMADLSLKEQALRFVVDHQIIESLGDISETLLFLIGAMIIVELIDAHGGFIFITNRITTHDKRKLLLLVAFLTFFMSAVLDNLTTSIVMIMLIRKMIGNYRERWVFGSIIIIAANSGGAWSPIGDVTTIMLWVRGNVSTGGLIPHLFFPCLVSCLIPVLLVRRLLHGNITSPLRSEEDACAALLEVLPYRDRLSIFVLGILCLLLVPVFKTVTHLPPFMGVLLGVGILWLYTDLMYRRNRIDEDLKLSLTKIVHRIDGSTLLFFLGILLAVDVLRFSGILTSLSLWLDQNIGNVYIINLIVGVLSAIVDNVPIVAGVMGMYPVADAALLASSADPAYLMNFIQDGTFWLFLAYCAGVGGSMLIIGSAAGVVVMGLERINFIWYFRNISLMALCGYLGGAAVYYLQHLLF